jgi:outer membrane protein TolC
MEDVINHPASRARSARRALAALAGLSIAVASSSGSSQPLPSGAPPAPPATGASAALPERGVDPLAAGLAPVPGGLTPEEVGAVAARTRPSIRVKQAELRAAAARVDQAFAAFLPRVTGVAMYTRLSPLTLAFGSGALVGTQNAGLLHVGPCPGGAPGQCVLDSGNLPAGAQPFTIPVFLNQYTFQASVAVPISDYVLRLSQGYAAASHGEKAKRLELEAQALQESADAKVAFYNWVRARGGAIVASEAVAQAKAHLQDAKQTFEVGLISKADVLRLEAQVASAEQAEAEAGAYVGVAEEQLRTVLGVGGDHPLGIGVDVMHEAPTTPSEPLEAAQHQAFQRRLEIRALDETEYSLKEVESVARAGYLPRIDAFADAVYQNPNQRVFPQRGAFDFTWDVGARLTWVLNDTLTAPANVAEAKARTEAVTMQKQALRDGLRLEVASAYNDVAKAAVTIEAAERGLVAAEESLRVRRELFRNGKATGVDIVDAETELTRARLNQLNARVGLLVARTRLAHATGADSAPQKGR